MSDEATISVSVNPAEVAELSRLINLRAGYLREAIGKSTAWMAYYVARAAGAATAISKKNRKVIKNPLIRQTVEGRTWWSLYVAVRDYPIDSTMKAKYIPLYGATIAEARTQKGVKIGRSGLSRKGWLWMSNNANRTAYNTGGVKESVFTVKADLANTSNPSVTLHNKLKYAAFAMKSEKVGTIMSRGLNAFRKDLSRRAHIAIAKGI